MAQNSIFRQATMQAIKEIVEENAVSGRFGLILTEEGMEEISKRVVDLFEMTLELRAKTSEIFAGGLQQSSPQQQNSQPKNARKTNRLQFGEESPFPKSKNASEIYDYQQPPKNILQESSLTPQMDFRLPRKRYELTLEEKERMMGAKR